MGKFSDKLREEAALLRDQRNNPFILTKDVSYMNLDGGNWIVLSKDGSIDIANEISATSISTESIYMKSPDIITNSNGVYVQVDPNMIYVAGKHLRKAVIEGEKYFTRKDTPQYVLTGVPGEGQKQVNITDLVLEKEVFEEPNTAKMIAELTKIIEEMK